MARELHRVVITGMGAVSPMGKGVDALMQGIRDRRCTVRRMDSWSQYKGMRSLIGAPVPGPREDKTVPRQKRRSMSSMSFFALDATREALAEAGLAIGGEGGIRPERIGCIIGTTLGSAESINEFFEIILPDKNVDEAPAMLFFKCMTHSTAMNLAQYYGITGYVMATAAACASGLQAIGTGYELLRLGVQDAFICGGAEELHASVTGTFDLLFATSVKHNDSPCRSPRPFDAARDGLVCGEGAGVIVMETLEGARARGAKILAEVVGYHTGGSGEHISQSDAPTMAACMREALSQADIKPSEVDYVSAHATATEQGDKAEAEAIAEVFGDKTPVSSLKGYIGHTLGASGAIELAATIRMMQDDIIYPGLNLEKVADDCKGIAHVMEPLKGTLDITVKNSFAFGGVNTVLVCRKYKGN